MVYVALFTVSFPQNASFFLSLIISITMCDVLPSTKIGNKIFDFDQEEAFSD
jgi:hypothetical protein